MALHDCVINWEAPAILKDTKLPTTGAAWVGDHVYDGTVGGAIRKFRTLSRDQQSRIEMLIDAGVIAGLAATIVSSTDLKTIADRTDVPAV